MAKKKKKNTQKKPHLLFSVLALLLTGALIIGAAALVVYRDRLNIDALRRWITYRTLNTDINGSAEAFPYAGGDDQAVACLSNGIVIASAAGAHYYSFSGKQYAETMTAVDNPALASSSSAAVFYGAGSSDLSVFRNGELDTTYQLGDIHGIISAHISESGWLTVTSQQEGYKGTVTVFSSSGDRAIEISLSSSFVVDASVSADSSRVAVVTVSQDSGIFDSKLLIYPIDATEPSAELDLGNVMILDMEYEDGTIWLLAEDRLIAAAPDGSSMNQQEFGRSYLKGYSFGGDGFALILLGSYRLGSADQAYTAGPDAGILSTMQLHSQVLSYDAEGSYCSLLTGTALTIYDRQFAQYASTDVTLGARFTALTKDGSSLLADDQRAWLYIPD